MINTSNNNGYFCTLFITNKQCTKVMTFRNKKKILLPWVKKGFSIIIQCIWYFFRPPFILKYEISKKWVDNVTAKAKYIILTDQNNVISIPLIIIHLMKLNKSEGVTCPSTKTFSFTWILNIIWCKTGFFFCLKTHVMLFQT